MIADFISGAPAGTAAVLQILATAESLTDSVASDLYQLVPIAGLEAEHFLLALHQSNLIEPRNSEWSFPHETRSSLRTLVAADSEVIRRAHVSLLERGLDADPADAGSIVPSYLLTDVGKAYHSAYAGRVTEALDYYGEVASRTSRMGEITGAQWLASRFAAEQQNADVLPDDNTELLFIRAISLHREGNRRSADELFRKIAAKNEVNQYTAVACDILGVGLRRKNLGEAEQLFRRAVAITRAIGNRTGEGVHLHNLAQTLVTKQPIESEEIYRASLAIAEEQGDFYSAAIRKNGLGDLLAHKGVKYRSEAERLLREAVNYFREQRDLFGSGAPLTTLARLVAMDPSRQDEAEQLYREGISIAREYGDEVGLQLRLFGLAKLLANNRDRWEESAALLRQSLALPAAQGHAARARAVKRLLDQVQSTAAD